MAFNVEAPKYLDHGTPDFGIFHLNITQASELVSKILCLEGRLDVALPNDAENYSLNTPELDGLLDKHINSYASVIAAGIDNGSLEAALISRQIDNTVILNETFVNVWHLVDWLVERSTDIRGDWFEDYVDGEFRVSEAVGEAVHLERHKIKEGRSRREFASADEQIASLTAEILSLRSMALEREPRKKPIKPLHTKEKETLLKLVIGMAIDGYGYDPDIKRSSIPKEIADALAERGIQLDVDTVRKWLKEAKDLLPRPLDGEAD